MKAVLPNIYCLCYVVLMSGCQKNERVNEVEVTIERINQKVTVKLEPIESDVIIDHAKGQSTTVFPGRVTALQETHGINEFVGILAVGNAKSVKVLAHFDEARGAFEVIVDSTLPVSLKARVEDLDSPDGFREVATKSVQPGSYTLRMPNDS